MASNYVFDDIESLVATIRGLSEQNPERVWITGVAGKVSSKAPTAKRKDAILAIEHHFDGSDLFVGNSVTALTSGSGVFLLHVPRERVNPELFTDENENSLHREQVDIPTSHK